MGRVVGRIGLLGILLATFLVYLPSLDNGFTHDDVFAAKAYIAPERPNVMVAEVQPLGAYLRAPYWQGSGKRTGLYRPLTVLSFALVHDWFGRDSDREAFPQRLMNLLLHVAATWLVYLLLRPFVGSAWPALAGAAVFGLHGVHSEPVLAIVGRADLLAFVLGATSVLCCERAGADRGVRRAVLFGLGATLALLAFTSKESAVAWAPFSVVYGLALTWRNRDADPGRELVLGAVRRFAVFLLPLLCFLALRHSVIESIPAEVRLPMPEANPLVALSFVQRMLTATTILTFGALRILLPIDLCCYYGHAVFEVVRSPLDVRFLVCGALLIGSLIGSLAMARRHPLLFLAGAAFFGFSFLTSNIPFVVGVDFGERLLYLPSLGLSFLVAWIFGLVQTSGWRLARVLLLVAWLAWSIALVMQRNPVWRDSDTLYLNDVRVNPASYFLMAAAAKALGARGDLRGSESLFQRAIEISSEHGLAWANLGITRMRLGKLREARQHLLRALELLEDKEKRALVHYNLATLATHSDDAEGVLRHLKRAVEGAPQVAMFRADLLGVGRGILRRDELQALLDEGEARAPGSPRWLVARAQMHLDRQELQQAEALVREALKQMPGEAMATLTLGELSARRASTLR